MEFRCENVDKLAVHSLSINIFCNELTDKVLPSAGPAVQREDQGLLRIVIGHESVHGFQDDAGCDVLSEQLAVQVGLESWKVQNTEISTGTSDVHLTLRHSWIAKISYLDSGTSNPSDL